MSTLKADAVTSAQDNTALTLSGTGTGGVKVNDFFVQTKGADIASGTTLTLGKDGNQFDITGTTTITGIATQGIGSYVTLHFDGILTFTHHSTNLILPGAANITTAAGDIAVMYEYASADWRCVSYTKASGAAVVAGGGWTKITEQATTSGTGVTFDLSGTSDIKVVHINFNNVSMDGTDDLDIQLGDSGGIETSGYDANKAGLVNGGATVATNDTDAFGIETSADATRQINGTFILSLEDASAFQWVGGGVFGASTNRMQISGGEKALSAELTQILISPSGSNNFDLGGISILIQA